MSAEELSEVGRKFLAQRTIARWFLHRTKPKSISLVTSYSVPGWVAAAREMGVRSGELQHGHLSRWHFGYSWSSLAAANASVIPIPDKLLCYGMHWVNALKGQEIWAGRTDCIGSPAVDRARAQAQDWNERERTIVFTSQGLEKDASRAFLSELLRELPDWRMVLLLHPAEADTGDWSSWAQRIPRVEVVPSGQSSTLGWFGRARAHVSISSTCHYESVALGCKTIVLPSRSAGFVEDLRAVYEGGFVDSAEQAANWLASPPGADSVQAGRHFFAPPAERSMEATDIWH